MSISDLNKFFPIKNYNELITCISQNEEIFKKILKNKINDEQKETKKLKDEIKKINKNKNEETQKLKDEIKKINENKNEETKNLKDEIKKLKDEIEEINEKNKKNLCYLSDLKSKSIGIHSSCIGIFDEESKKIWFTTEFGENFEVSNIKENKMMDIRLTNKISGYVIGVECKSKIRILKDDIKKFEKDHYANNFKGSIFISSRSSSICDIVKGSNKYILKDKKLFLCSSDPIFMKTIINFFIQYIEITSNDDKNNENFEFLSGSFSVLYNQWQASKKQLKELDKTFSNMIDTLSISNKDHIYFVPKSLCVSKKKPY